MTFKWIKAGVALLALLVTPFIAEAADKSVKQPVVKAIPRSVVAYYSWAGLYGGINLGYGFGTSSWATPASISPKGWLAGLTVGHNWQQGNTVFGIEGDYSWSWIKGDTACGATTCAMKNNWISTIRGRLGQANDRTLMYLTGGLAAGDISASRLTTGTVSTKQTGWTVGAGMEFALQGNMTAKLEYLYVDLGKFDCGAVCSATAPSDVNFRTSLVRAGLNMKFGAGPMGPISSRF